MCLQGNIDEPCDHTECNLPPSLFTNSTNRSELLKSLVLMLINRNNILLNLSNLASQMEEKTAKLVTKPSSESKVKESKKSVFYSQDTYDLKIVITGQVPNMVLKEKGFPLEVEVRDSNDQSVFCEQIFKVRLFTNEEVPKPLKLNIASKKIIRGTLEAKMSGNNLVSFDNIVINEVSSHYIRESFILVISTESDDIKSLVIENLCVRARNSNKKQV